MRKIGALSLLSLCLFFFCSCLALQPQRARDLYVQAGYIEVVKNSAFILDRLSVTKGFDSRLLEENAAYVFHLVLGQRNQEVADRDKTLRLRAVIKEREFSRDFRTLHTVTVELSLFDPPREKAVALLLYSENTRETIESYTYLHGVIQRALRYMSR
jgi:hypothetical protein